MYGWSPPSLIFGSLEPTEDQTIFRRSQSSHTPFQLRFRQSRWGRRRARDSGSQRVGMAAAYGAHGSSKGCGDLGLVIRFFC
ncbi:hypothetical protein ES332_D10G221900v1 [Gossypium tomentosum]|uniref:Uncharacterized protein n=1 Tax=Gossypium tomentosum TaxID=34277 RepID=A0A5D2J6Z5_GOSTO|nr:hypothetical protein ES332_D10G221900v1 [Gossypium tomentosum]